MTEKTSAEIEDYHLASSWLHGVVVERISRWLFHKTNTSTNTAAILLHVLPLDGVVSCAKSRRLSCARASNDLDLIMKHAKAAHRPHWRHHQNRFNVVIRFLCRIPLDRPRVHFHNHRGVWPSNWLNPLPKGTLRTQPVFRLL